MRGFVMSSSLLTASAVSIMMMLAVASSGSATNLEGLLSRTKGDSLFPAAAPNCTMITGVVLGNHMDLKMVSSASPGDCCTSCDETYGCVAWTYNEQYSQCYLKYSASPAMNQSDHVSGYRSTPMPPLPPMVSAVDCQSPPQSGYPFCDPSLPVDQRADDLVSRLTLEELINQTWSIAPAIDRLGIKAYNWRSNCVHGWTNGPDPWPYGTCWTVFPNPMGMGASFDLDLVLKIGQITSQEGRALHNLALRLNNGSSAEAAGLNCFSPNVNLYRDPRWGRNEEVFGEDTFHMGSMGVRYTKGVQNDPSGSTKYLKIAACSKHYAVHDGPDDLRETFTAEVSSFDLFDTFLPSTEAQVMDAKIAQVMPAYSAMKSPGSPDGAPDCANDFLIKDILRTRFGGHNISVCSDNGGIWMVKATHRYVDTYEEAAAISMNATTDIDLGHDAIYADYLPSAVKDGMVSVDSIAAAVRRNMALRMRLGDFDPLDQVPYQHINSSALNTLTSQAVNLEAAEKSLVLLKNIDKTLPVSSKGLSKVAVIGPNVDLVPNADYAGTPCNTTTVASAITAKFNNTDTQVVVSQGCQNAACENSTGLVDASIAAMDADLVVLVMGLDGTLEGEGHDRQAHACDGQSRSIFGLPGCQGDLVQLITKSNAKQIVLVLLHGGAVATPVESVDPRIGAILDGFYPGPLGGMAITRAIFGDSVPGGRLPVTIYDPAEPMEPMTNYDMTAGLGRTYRFYTGKALYPFGFGLSYYGAVFATYSNLAVTATSIVACSTINVTVSVKSPALITGDEVVQLYVSYPEGLEPGFPIPLRTLQGFKRVSLGPGSTDTVTFTLDAWSFSLTNGFGDRVILPGQYTIYAGGSQPGAASSISLPGPKPLSTQVNITTSSGDAIDIRNTCKSLDRPCYACSV